VFATVSAYAALALVRKSVPRLPTALFPRTHHARSPSLAL
jgi:hypothetical protein